MPYKHRQQQLQYQRDHYLKNKEEYRSRWSRQRIANKEYVDLIKENPVVHFVERKDQLV